MSTHPPGSRKLRAWRKRRVPKMTLKIAGEAIGVSHSSWSEWEGGSRTPSLEKALVVEALTDGAVTIEDWLFDATVIPSARRVIERRDAAVRAASSEAA